MAPEREAVQTNSGLQSLKDEPTGGVFTLFLYADGSVADEWREPSDDALAALKDAGKCQSRRTAFEERSV